MPSLYKPLIIGSMLMVFQQFSGVNAILFYDSKIFSSAGLTNSAEVSLLVGASQVVATAIGCLIVDRTGRKKLLFIGGIVMGVTLFLLGMYYDLASINNKEAKKVSIFGKYSHTVPEDHISWMAILSVVIFIVMFSIGWGPLPWVLMSEIFPPRARGLGCGMVTLVNWSLVFAITRTFDEMTESLSQQGTFWFFAFSSFMSVLYTLCFVPETKGKSLEEIELVFNRGARSREEISQT